MTRSFFVSVRFRSIGLNPIQLKPTKLKHQLTIILHYKYKKFDPKWQLNLPSWRQEFQTISKGCIYLAEAAKIFEKYGD